jgi:hypothetical protein
MIENILAKINFTVSHKYKVKLSKYRPGQAHRAPGV